MKKIMCSLALILCAAMLFSCSVKGGDERSVAESREITDADGNVVAMGFYDKNGDIVYEEQSDSAGNISKRTFYDKEGRVTGVTEYASNIKTKETAYTYGGDAGSYTKKETVFSNKGISVSVTDTVYEKDLAVSRVYTMLDANGKTVGVEETSFEYKKDGTVLETISSDGKIIRECLQDGNGIVIYDYDTVNGTKTFYNEATAPIRVENYDGEKLTSYCENEYNEDGKVSRKTDYSGDGKLLSYTEYEYDKDGRITKANTFKEGEVLQYYSVYTYYDNGHTKSIVKFNADGTIHTSVTYDEDGKATVTPGEGR